MTDRLTIRQNANFEWVIVDGDTTYPVHIEISGNGWTVSNAKFAEVNFTTYGKEYTAMVGTNGEVIVAMVDSDGAMATSIDLPVGSPVTKLFRKIGLGNHGKMESIAIDVPFDRQRY